jgi:hypothetical protein
MEMRENECGCRKVWSSPLLVQASGVEVQTRPSFMIATLFREKMV